MKKSELRKLIREVISEQHGSLTEQQGGINSWGCAAGPNCIPPTLETDVNIAGSQPGVYVNRLRCPTGWRFQGYPGQVPSYSTAPSQAGKFLSPISYCVPDIGNPGDSNLAGHGSTDNPFVPGMGFEDQFIDQITGPGGPFGGDKDGGKGKPIRESKKRRK